jgi:hypothetical protein
MICRLGLGSPIGIWVNPVDPGADLLALCCRGQTSLEAQNTQLINTNQYTHIQISNIPLTMKLQAQKASNPTKKRGKSLPSSAITPKVKAP